ncbi:MAG: hypothetical protein HY397_01620 [Candidatus Doudnabacteria bacterium]|nr:hypothetical protein [Candidatus Doudnabacteria bacterium]
MLSKNELKKLRNFQEPLKGKWIAFGGNRWISAKTFQRTMLITRELIRKKCKIVTGGAEGVDHAIVQACLKYRILTGHLKMYLPYTIQKQYEHYRKLEGPRKAKKLTEALVAIKKMYPRSVIENHKKFVNYRIAANYRNSLIERSASAMIMVSPKGSRGSASVLRKAIRVKIPCLIFSS